MPRRFSVICKALCGKQKHVAGRVATWDADDIPLGILNSTEYPSGRKTLFGCGDCLVLVSDGLLDWRDGAGVSYGADRLRASIERNAHLSAETLIEAMMFDVKDFAGETPQTDDVSTVVVKCTG